MSAIFGGSKSKQKSQSTSSSNSQSASWNEAYPWLKDTYGGGATKGLEAQDFISSLLGLNGNPAATDAYDQYKDSAGYDSVMDSGIKAIEGSAAGRRMLRSGATGKALSNFGQNTGAQFFNSYLDKLLGLSNQGLQIGQLIGGAGQRSIGQSQAQSQSTSSGSSSSKPGIGAFLGQIASGVAASDRRLKENIEPIARLENGLTVYTWDYIDGRGPFIGVMADEVADIQPEALGPVIDGYATVDYSKIEGWE